MSNLSFKPMINVNAPLPQAGKPKGRKQFIVDPRFQYGFLAWMVTLALVVTGIIYGANYYFFFKYEQRGLEMGLTPDHVFFRLLQEQRADMNVIFVVASLVCIAFLTFAGAILSHRVAGPIYKMRKHIDAVVRNETVQDITFRKNDYFPELAEAFNKLLAPIRAARKKKGSSAMKTRSSSATLRVG